MKYLAIFTCFMAFVVALVFGQSTYIPYVPLLDLASIDVPLDILAICMPSLYVYYQNMVNQVPINPINIMKTDNNLSNLNIQLTVIDGVPTDSVQTDTTTTDSVQTDTTTTDRIQQLNSAGINSVGKLSIILIILTTVIVGLI